jgi:putative transposase
MAERKGSPGRAQERRTALGKKGTGAIKFVIEKVPPSPHYPAYAPPCPSGSSGVAHHITQRGNNSQPVFHSFGDRHVYLDLLIHYALRQGVRILGYCFMTNHVHLVASPESAESLARAMSRVHSEYAAVSNRAEHRTGHLWESRYFSCPLDQSHLLAALRYVDENPARAGMVKRAGDWPWSSARAHCIEGVRDTVLSAGWTERLDGWSYKEWNDILHDDSGVPAIAQWDAMRRATLTGEPFGSEEFLSQIEHQTGRRLRVLSQGRPRKNKGACPLFGHRIQ